MTFLAFWTWIKENSVSGSYKNTQLARSSSLLLVLHCRGGRSTRALRFIVSADTASPVFCGRAADPDLLWRQHYCGIRSAVWPGFSRGATAEVGSQRIPL